MRVDNHGEGGTLALMALAQRAVRRSGVVVLLGIVAAALFYGDAVITPALSVLSAVEGLEVVAPHLEAFVLPLSRGPADISRLLKGVTPARRDRSGS
jgi:KUP system potassium uptake protein